jgi:hypothetical protein
MRFLRRLRHLIGRRDFDAELSKNSTVIASSGSETTSTAA